MRIAETNPGRAPVSVHQPQPLSLCSKTTKKNKQTEESATVVSSLSSAPLASVQHTSIKIKMNVVKHCVSEPVLLSLEDGSVLVSFHRLLFTPLMFAKLCVTCRKEKKKSKSKEDINNSNNHMKQKS